MKKEVIPAVSVIIECYLPDLIEMVLAYDDYESVDDTVFAYNYARIANHIVKKTKDWLEDVIKCYAPNIIVEEDEYVFSGDYNYGADIMEFSLKLDNDDDNVEHVAFHAVKRMLEEDGAYEDGAYEAFLEYLKRITTSRSGYIPRYEMEEVLRTPHLFVQFAIQFKFKCDYNIICEYILS